MTNEWEPYGYQEQISNLILAGKSVVLQAPTGSGKTTAALLPFLYARQNLSSKDFPRKCIYSVPLRILANQFYEEYSKVIRRYGWENKLNVRIQTGVMDKDKLMEGDLIFTTIDQILSSFLNIPYGLSKKQANLNAGAVFSSYLVFDELHLLDPEASLPTTLYLLKMLKGIVPFLVMTATFSTEMVKSIANQLDATPYILNKEEAQKLTSQQKTRRFHYTDQPLTPESVLLKHSNSDGSRSIAICNTVNRAQNLFERIKDLADSKTMVKLIHSRFLQKDRNTTEEWLRREFGKQKENYTVESAILVATQVVEVGVDMTSTALHTELAPAANIIQRAGRCARYSGEQGDVYIYSLPSDEQGNPFYAPYHEKGQKRICEKTREILQQKEFNGQVLDFNDELTLVNHAYEEADKKIIEQMQSSRSILRDKIYHTIQTQDRGAVPDLIRDVESCSVIVHPEPHLLDDPWEYEGISFFRGSLIGAYEDLVNQGVEEDWIIKMAEACQENDGSREKTIWKWNNVTCKKDLAGCILVVVNPKLVNYSSEEGFRLGVVATTHFESPKRRKEKPIFRKPYQRESYVQHIAGLLNVYQNSIFDNEDNCDRQSLADEIAFSAGQLEQKNTWPAGTLDRLIRLVIAFHDIGKLDRSWQEWAHTWQERVSILRGQNLKMPEEYMLAHTDYDPNSEAERRGNREVGPRPDHAVEGAAAAYEYFKSEMKNDCDLVLPAMTAIASHHTPGIRGISQHGLHAHAASPKELFKALKKAGLQPDLKLIKFKLTPAEAAITNRMIDFNNPKQLITYLLLSRVLRLADQRSLELKGEVSSDRIEFP